MGKRRTIGLIAAGLIVLAAPSAHAATTEAVNTPAEAVTAASLSGDGRYVAVVSGTGKLFVHDRVKGTAVMLSPRAATGMPIAISSGGRYVAFTRPSGSDPTALYVFDRKKGRTREATVGTRGRPLRMQYGNEFSITADGRYVAWVGGTRWRHINADSEGERSGNRHAALYVRDLKRARTQRVGPVFDQFGGNGDQYDAPSLSAGARHVAFRRLSRAPSRMGVFVRDLRRGVNERVDVSSGGERADEDLVSRRVLVSADGRYVAFDSSAANLVEGDTNDRNDVFVRDRSARTTKRVSVDESGAELVKGGTLKDFSGDGSVALFDSDSPIFGTNVFAARVAEGRGGIVNYAPDGHRLSYESYSDAAVSDDGTTALFVAYDGENRYPQGAFVRTPLP